MQYISLLIAWALLHEVRGDRPSVPYLEQKGDEPQETLSLSVGVKNLHRISLHTSHQEDKRAVAKSSSSSLLQSSLMQNSFNDTYHPHDAPPGWTLHATYIANRPIPIGHNGHRGTVPIGSRGQVEMDHGEHFKVKWEMPITYAGGWHQAVAYTAIDTQFPPQHGKVHTSMVNPRGYAKKPIGWKIPLAGFGTSVRQNKDAYKPGHCYDWMIQCRYPQFGEVNRKNATLYMKRVHIVRYKNGDPMGGCDYFFECMNTEPKGPIDLDTSEFIRSGPDGGWLGTGGLTGNHFYHAVVGNHLTNREKNQAGVDGYKRLQVKRHLHHELDDISNNIWEKLCNVCGYTTRGIGCGGSGNPLCVPTRPDDCIYEDWSRKKIFERDGR